MSVPWSSTNLDTSADSRIGDLSNFTNLAALPNVPTSVRDLNQDSGTAPPLDTTLSSVQVNPGSSLNERKAQGQVTVGGSVGGSMSIVNGGGSNARNRNDNTTHGAQFNGASVFTGEFVSNGTVLHLDYSGIYDLFAFGQNNRGFSLDRQRAFARISATLAVHDLTTATTLASTTLVSDSRNQQTCGFPCLPLSLFDQAFADSLTIDLDSTAGHAIEVTLATAVVSKAYAGHHSFDSSGQTTGAIANASFNDFTFAFTTEEGAAAVPGPATLTVLALGLAGLGIMRRRAKNGLSSGAAA